jgi:hypothetical protein
MVMYTTVTGKDTGIQAQQIIMQLYNHPLMAIMEDWMDIIT